MNKQLSKNESAVLGVLATMEGPVVAAEIKVDGLKTNIVGKIASNLSKLGLVESAKYGYIHKWIITGSGLQVLQNYGNGITEVPNGSNGVTEHVEDTPELSISLAGSGAPPVDPRNFIYVVSEERMGQMLSARLGLNGDEVALLKARVATLEATIHENARTIRKLRADLAAALQLGEMAEKKFNKIMKLQQQMSEIAKD